MKRTIAGKNYQFGETAIPIGKLRFWPENPRIYADIHSRYGRKVSKMKPAKLQKNIYEKLKTRKDIHELRRHIEDEGGLAEPLIVRKNNQNGNYDVLEGNRRLAACMMIEEATKVNKQPKLTCEVMPKNFPKSHIFTLLSTLHVPGKLQWDPFVKASLVARRFEELKKEKNSEDAALGTARKEFSTTTPKVKAFIANINLMKWAKEKNTEKYSYYDVLNCDKIVYEDLKNYNLKRRWVDSIQTWTKQAGEFRAAVKAVVTDSEALEKFREGVLNLEESAQQARDSGNTDVVYQRVRKFRTSIENAKLGFEKMKAKDPVVPKLQSEFKSLKALAEDVIKILGKKNG